MNSASFRIMAYLASACLLLSEFESFAARGGGGRGGGGGGRAFSRGGGAGRVGGMGGGGRALSRPAVSGGGYGGGGSKVASRPSISSAGGLVPNKNVSAGNINKSQAASKIESLPKGTGTGLPSVAQGKKPGAGAGGNKGFPDLAGKTGGGQLSGKVQGAKGGQLAGKLQGAQGGQLAGKLHLQGAHLRGERWLPRVVTLAADSRAAALGERANNFSPERNQAIAISIVVFGPLAAIRRTPAGFPQLD